MSATKTEDGHSKPHHLKAEQDEECDKTVGKPCIDFQPDDSWHIKEGNEEEGCNNSKRRRSARKRKNNSQYSKEKRSVVAINGESVKLTDNKSNSHYENASDIASGKCDDSIVVADDSLAVADDSLAVADDSLAVAEEMKCNRLNSDVVSEPDNDISPSSKQKPPSPYNRPSANDRVKPSSPKNTNGIVNELECADNVRINSQQEFGKSLLETQSSNDDVSKCAEDANKLAPVLEDERTKKTVNEDGKECSSMSEEGSSKDQPMPELSSNENSQSSFKKEDADIAIIEEKLSNVNSEVVDSDNEVQIISSTDRDSPVVSFPDEKLYEQSLSKEQTLSKEELLLSPGFPYFNSLQENVKGFKAGKYKPVKFPHMGTLMLEENEVIIESPSLLVPLLIKEADEFPVLEEENNGSVAENSSTSRPKAIRRNFFQSSVGQFLINLGASRVLEWYHKDMRRSKQKQLRKDVNNQEHKDALEYHHKKLVAAKEANVAFNFRMRKCEFCDFKTESRLVIDGHYLIPHLTPRREFRCNFCPFISRDYKEMAFHFEAIHSKILVSDDQIILHECRFCSFHSHIKSKVNTHMNRCRKYFLPSQNQSPPFDFEFPGVTTKPVTIADVIAHRRMLLGSTKAPYTNSGQAASAVDSVTSAFARKKLASVLNLTGAEAFPDSPTLIKHLMGPHSKQTPTGFQLPPGIVLTRPRVRAQQVRQATQSLQPRIPGLRPSVPRSTAPYPSNITSTASHLASSGISITPITKQDSSTARMSAGPQATGKNITLTPISSAGNQVVSQKPGPPQPVALFTNVAGSEVSKTRAGMVPMTQASRMPLATGGRPSRMTPPFQRLTTPPSQVVKNSSGSTFVLCEICDSYIKDLEELRSHMNWVHKVKIHPKMLVSRPPLNCQKCQWRFFTDQGLERHLLGAHGLVTTNMQEMANKNQDGGRCIICGAVFTYKLVSHMTQVHKVTLKPAHLSYKCTVCTATFTLYRLFESHVYNVHSASAKRPAEESSSNEPPPKKVAPPELEQPKPEQPATKKCHECGFITDNMEKHIIQKHLKECSVKLCRIEKCEKCLYSSDEMLVIRMPLFDADSESDDDDESSEEENEKVSDTDTSSESSRIKSEEKANHSDDEEKKAIE